MLYRQSAFEQVIPGMVAGGGGVGVVVDTKSTPIVYLCGVVVTQKYTNSLDLCFNITYHVTEIVIVKI